jgi:hypothetical protein
MTARPQPFDLSTKGINARAKEPQAFELDTYTRTRLMLAGQIAAGLASNPEQVSMPRWEAETARAALSVADKLIALTVTGGL